MTQTVWKFPFAIADEFVVRLPRGARVLHVGVQGAAPEFGLIGTPTFWALVTPDAPAEDVAFAVRGTGHDCAGLTEHCGSFFYGPLVFHLFRRVP